MNKNKTAIAHADNSDSGQVYFSIQEGYSKQTFVDGNNQQNTLNISDNRYSLTKQDRIFALLIGYENAKNRELRYDFSVVLYDNINHSIKISDTVTREIKTNHSSFATTIYWDFYNSSSITPYISYSGMFLESHVSIDDNDSTSSKPIQDFKSVIQAAWGVGVGFSYNISTNWRADVEAKYIGDGLYFLPHPTNMDTREKETKLSWEKIEIINVMLGLRYDF